MIKHSIDSLYVHVPFCSRKCRYCAFYSLPRPNHLQRQEFLRQLDSEFAEYADRCGKLQTVFIGGGTPSSLEPGEIEQLFRQIRKWFQIADDAEITVENNPESLTPEKLNLYAAAGVNRISIGIQTFDFEHRILIGRHGDLIKLSMITAELHNLGIENINFDLIYGIPGQSLPAWKEDLECALDYGIQHLSTYSLTIEEGTALAQDEFLPVSDAQQVQMWELAEEVGRTYGLQRYEVSNFARPGFECRHNLRIWHGANYLGCGPAASSFDGSLRWTNVASLERWLANQPPEFDELTPEARAAEILAFGLRTVRGWGRPEFRDCAGYDYLDLCAAEIAELVDDGLLVLKNDILRPTERGLLFADEVLARILRY